MTKLALGIRLRTRISLKPAAVKSEKPLIQMLILRDGLAVKLQSLIVFQMKQKNYMVVFLVYSLGGGLSSNQIQVLLIGTRYGMLL